MNWETWQLVLFAMVVFGLGASFMWLLIWAMGGDAYLSGYRTGYRAGLQKGHYRFTYNPRDHE